MSIGRASGTPAGARMNAREAYLSALIRARRDRSVDGALRSAEAFRQLGDRAVVEQSLHIAGQLAAGDEQAQAKVRVADLRPALCGLLVSILVRRQLGLPGQGSPGLELRE